MISKLLCIDDDVATLTLIKMVVERALFAKEILTCTSGVEALTYYQGLKEEKSADAPELIFLDLDMPVIDGLEFLEEFSRRYYSQFNQTKVVILSSSIKVDNVSACYPIIGYITKPLTANSLKRLMT